MQIEEKCDYLHFNVSHEKHIERLYFFTFTPAVACHCSWTSVNCLLIQYSPKVNKYAP